ncbi:hypothetical protein MATL_G00100010 [Megalops atlanticus]|uniref:Uncharacterized protein n=1 Tax=Megalops atlanticus TaxID=7932 RepID=A0A9D3Q2M3_MEGAT|nr:hypothetical protein MATL_G00100010 [Megalops atlanticus]
MPVVQSGSGATSQDQSVQEALELFCSSPEQTYADFLASFTCLSAENVESDGGLALVLRPHPPCERMGGGVHRAQE